VHLLALERVPAERQRRIVCAREAYVGVCRCTSTERALCGRHPGTWQVSMFPAMLSRPLAPSLPSSRLTPKSSNHPPPHATSPPLLASHSITYSRYESHFCVLTSPPARPRFLVLPRFLPSPPLSIDQLLKQGRANQCVRLRADPAGRASLTRQDDRHGLHRVRLRRPPLQVSLPA